MTMNEKWPTVREMTGDNPNVWKYVFERDNAVAEAVLYRYPTFEERTVICCSTQSGCPVGYRFCGAGDSFVRSLSAEDIVAQVTHLLDKHDIDHRKVGRLQIMFMSMGEPMLNYRGLSGAIRMLHNLYPEAALLISTIGPDTRLAFVALEKLSKEVPTVGLQFSVHESTDEARNKLIPFRDKLSLSQIALMGERWSAATGRRPFFNYCAHEGNTSDEDVERLEALFDPAVWECTVSVICEREEHVAAANERQRSLASDFSSRMVQAGYNVRVFDPAGQDDIGGGCGQLWFVQDWMSKHPELARPSAGRSLPVVHTPGR